MRSNLPRAVLSLAALMAAALASLSAQADEKVRVVIWDERQPRQKQAYEDFLGNAIGSYLAKRPGLTVRSMSIDDAEKGISAELLDFAQVLVWWGHVRQAEITPEQGQAIVQRIKEGRLSLIALHSAHWSTPFVEAMNERTRTNVMARFQGDSKQLEFEYIRPNPRYRAPKKDTKLTPYAEPRKFPNGRSKILVHLPNCCFPAYRPDGKPSFLLTKLPDHPIAKGVPARFSVAGTEMYDEPFHVPDPDEVVFEERWPTGEWFRSGAIWKIGKGKIFYFRPGHETYPVYKQEIPLKIIENAVRWMGKE